MSPSKILVVEKDVLVIKAIAHALKRHGHTIINGDSASALTIIRKMKPTVMLIGLPLPRLVDQDLIRHLRDEHPDLPVIVLSPCGNMEQASTALVMGAVDVLVKPIDAEKLVRTIAQTMGHPGDALRALPGSGQGAVLAGSSLAMQAVFRELALAAASDAPTLITGPPGSGKSLVAWIIHANSGRRAQRFHSFDARVIPAAPAVEALTGRLGILSLTAEGTAVIDGARCLPDEALTRILTNRQATSRIILIADATPDGWVDPAWIDMLRLRQVIALPPLRKRDDDLRLIASHLLQRQADRVGRPLELSGQALAAMQSHLWPGNVRELAESIIVAANAAMDGIIRPEHLCLGESPGGDNTGHHLRDYADDLLDSSTDNAYQRWLDRMDMIVLERAMIQSRGNQLRAATRLGIHRATLRKRMAQLGISIPRHRTLTPKQTTLKSIRAKQK